MWETTKQIFQSQHPLSGIVYLFLGAIIGAVLGTHSSLKAQRPKLKYGGHGGGGDQKKQAWTVTILNRPSFFGQILNGEPAHDVFATIHQKGEDTRHYLIHWHGEPREQKVTLQPGHSRILPLFHWQEGKPGYFIVDGDGEPVANFQSRRLAFIIQLTDRFGRITKLPMKVEFDDTHLRNAPTLTLRLPPGLRGRWDRARMGARQLLRAFSRN